MKIKSKFIPLILNKRKKWEFRNSNDKEGIYIINEEYYYLKNAELVSTYPNPNAKYEKFKTFKDWLFERIKMSNIQLDIETKKWLEKNSNSYFKTNKNGYEYECYIYQWIKLNELPLTDFEILEDDENYDEELYEDLHPVIFGVNLCAKINSVFDLISMLSKQERENIKKQILEYFIKGNEIKQLEIID